MCGKEIKNYKKIMALHFKVSINKASRVVLWFLVLPNLSMVNWISILLIRLRKHKLSFYKYFKRCVHNINDFFNLPYIKSILMDNIISSEHMLLNGYMSFLVVSSFTFKNLHVLHNYSVSLCRWLFPVNEVVHLQENKTKHAL